MKQEKKEKIYKNMEEVIETSKTIRSYLLNRTIPYEERKSELEFIKTALSANKSIVASATTIISCYKLGLENENE